LLWRAFTPIVETELDADLPHLSVKMDDRLPFSTLVKEIPVRIIDSLGAGRRPVCPDVVLSFRLSPSESDKTRAKKANKRKAG